MIAEAAILKTLGYSDIFGFPLTKDEIWKYLISDKKVTRQIFELALHNLSQKRLPRSLHSIAMTRIIFKDGYYCLKGRENIIVKRQKNRPEVEKKMQIARRAVRYLSFIPTISFIGISGGLAMGDVEKQDDIDLFIIAEKDTLFKTRLFMLLILELLGLRRSKKDKNPIDKICANFLIDETKLGFPVERRDLYTAHEIAQIKPVLERKNVFSAFLKSNRWVNNFLPNFVLSDTPKHTQIKNNNMSSQIASFLLQLVPEAILKTMQVAFMKRHMRNEVVTSHVLIFHPHDYRVQTLKHLRLKYRKLGLLTKK